MPTRSINNCSSSSTTLLLKPQLESEEELCENWRAAGCLSNLGKILNHGNYVTNFHLSWVFFVVDEEFQTPEKPTTLVGDSNWSSCLLRYAISDIFQTITMCLKSLPKSPIGQRFFRLKMIR